MIGPGFVPVICIFWESVVSRQCNLFDYTLSPQCTDPPPKNKLNGQKMGSASLKSNKSNYPNCHIKLTSTVHCKASGTYNIF